MRLPVTTLFSVLATASSSVFADCGLEQAIDCGCGQTGLYALPIAPTALFLGPNGMSHYGSYFARLSPGSSNFNLDLIRVVDGATLLRVGNVPQNCAYGFSPSDRAFAYLYARAPGSPDTPSEAGGLYSLTNISSIPIAPVWAFERPMNTSVAFEFSPHDRYFVSSITPIDSGTTDLLVIEPQTGRVALSTTLHWTQPPSGGMFEAWAFSPDVLDRGFSFAYDLDQAKVSLNLVNLETATIVFSRILDPTGLQNRENFSWRFSPCGDVFGLLSGHVANGTYGKNVELFYTRDGTLLAGPWLFGSNVVLSVNNASHIATDVSPTVIAANRATSGCIIPNPTWVDFGYFGAECGTFDSPFRTLRNGVNAAVVNGSVTIKAGSSPDVLAITKSVTIRSFGGAATVGR
jgi:hypothetical protein